MCPHARPDRITLVVRARYESRSTGSTGPFGPLRSRVRSRLRDGWFNRRSELVCSRLLSQSCIVEGSSQDAKFRNRLVLHHFRKGLEKRPVDGCKRIDGGWIELDEVASTIFRMGHTP